MSTRNISWEGKGGRCVGLTTLPPSCDDCLEIWEPQIPGILTACLCFTFLPLAVSHPVSQPVNYETLSNFLVQTLAVNAPFPHYKCCTLRESHETNILWGGKNAIFNTEAGGITAIYRVVNPGLLPRSRGIIHTFYTHRNMQGHVAFSKIIFHCISLRVFKWNLFIYLFIYTHRHI